MLTLSSSSPTTFACLARALLSFNLFVAFGSSFTLVDGLDLLSDDTLRLEGLDCLLPSSSGGLLPPWQSLLLCWRCYGCTCLWFCHRTTTTSYCSTICICRVPFSQFPGTTIVVFHWCVAGSGFLACCDYFDRFCSWVWIWPSSIHWLRLGEQGFAVLRVLVPAIGPFHKWYCTCSWPTAWVHLLWLAGLLRMHQVSFQCTYEKFDLCILVSLWRGWSIYHHLSCLGLPGRSWS